jgi:hypothetical protein
MAAQSCGIKQKRKPLLGSKNCSFFGSRSRQWLVKAVNVKTVRSSSKDSLSLSLSLWPSLRDFSNWSSAPKTETISALSNCSFYRVETGWSKLLKTWWDWAGFRVNILVSLVRNSTLSSCNEIKFNNYSNKHHYSC